MTTEIVRIVADDVYDEFPTAPYDALEAIVASTMRIVDQRWEQIALARQRGEL